MAAGEPAFTLGIEEEYLLVDRLTRDLVSEPPKDLLAACEALAPGQVHPEFLRCQVEVGTKVCPDIATARADLARLRSAVVSVADRHGLAPIAASTHPFAVWGPQKHTRRERYDKLARDMGAPAWRLMICGLHVHVGIEDADLRIDLMNEVKHFLPHLLALSTSSPFWQGDDTGLKSYRIAVWRELPRTGMPESFRSHAEFQSQIRTLVEAGVIEDATKLWWDVRPSANLPTLEMRIADICTRLDDTITVAALFVCLLRMLWRLRSRNMAWRGYGQLLIEENRWRAQRYGLDQGLLDFGRGTIRPHAELLEEIIALTAEDAEALGCGEAVANARDILRRGTSADRQLAVHREACVAGADPAEAMRAVVDWLIEETRRGLPPPPAEPPAGQPA